MRVADFIKRKKYYFYTVLIFIFIIIHGKFDSFFKIDNITLILLFLLFLLPYIPLVKRWKFKYGDFEAEVTKEEIEKIESQLAKLPAKETDLSKEKILDIRELAETDTQLALAKIRIEIEKQLKSLFNIYLPENSHHASRLSPRLTVESLKKRNILESSLANVLQDVIQVANRAIHGEEISKENALKLVNTASKALSELEDVILNHALRSVKKTVVSNESVRDYSHAQYILTTLVPYAKNPERNTYNLNQVELGAFLENYDQFAEFIIELKRIK